MEVGNSMKLIFYFAMNCPRRIVRELKHLPKVPTWQLERDLNPRPFRRKVSILPMSHHVPQNMLKLSNAYDVKAQLNDKFVCQNILDSFLPQMIYGWILEGKCGTSLRRKSSCFHVVLHTN